MSQPTKLCPYCAEEILATALKCRYCQEYLDPSLRRPQHDAVDRMLLPVGRPGSAIAAGYLGLIAMFPIIGILTGALAVWLGIRALGQMQRDPSLHGAGRAWFGILWGGLWASGQAVLWGLILLTALTQ